MSDRAMLQALAAYYRSLHGDGWFVEESKELDSIPTFSAEAFIVAATPTVVLALLAEVQTLSSQVVTLQSDPGSWQSGYDEGRNMGTKTALAEREQLATDKASLQKRLSHTEAWNANRFETLWHWAHRELVEPQITQYFNIVANGSASPDDPPVYAQQMNILKGRLDASEKACAALKADNEVLRQRCIDATNEAHDAKVDLETFTSGVADGQEADQ